MKQITFECETITPMFLAGADGKTPELRAPSIKGALRFWWRAMNSDLTYDQLLKEEEKLFGGTQTQNLKSPILLKISQPQFDEVHARTYKNYHGLAYLYYSMIHFGGGRSAVPPKTKFDVVLKAKGEKTIKKSIACFWLLTFFGGVGSRARRGCGNIQMQNAIDPDNLLDNLSFSFFPKEGEELNDFLKDNYLKVKELLKVNLNSKDQNNYSNLFDAKLCISDSGKNDWTDALNEIGNIFKNFRLDKNNRAILKWYESAAFGLPVKHKAFTVNSVFSARNDDPIKRRSSPVIIRIVKFNNEYYWMVLHLSGEFLPKNQNNEDIKTNRQNRRTAIRTIDNFMNSLNNSRQIVLK